MKKIVSVFVLLFFCATSFAKISLPAFFSNNMVLQRSKLIPVWGWANANEKITVQFHGQTKTTQAAANGNHSFDGYIAGVGRGVRGSGL